MSKGFTPTFIVKTVEERHYTTPMAWDYKRFGKPTNEKLAQFIIDLEESARPGGVNEHLGSFNIISAKVVRQATGDTEARYHRALFTVA